MPKHLFLQTSTEICSVAVAENAAILSHKSSSEARDHARWLTLLIEEALSAANWTFSDVEGIVVAEGPGSYTGLRIGAATAKGLCYALEIPLFAVNTLQAIAYSMQQAHRGSFYVAILPSRKGEMYAAIYDNNLKEVVPTGAYALSDQNIHHFLTTNEGIIIGGNGAEKFYVHNKLTHQTLVKGHNANAQQMVGLSQQLKLFKGGKSLIYFEPLYLKGVFTTS